MDPYELLGALRDIANPWPLAQEAPALFIEWTRIAAGISELQLPAKDARFSDPTWRDNPWYRRWAQAYLAWCDTVDRLVETADLDERERIRARYATSALTALTAPTNLLPGNPAALKRAFETSGASLLRGARNFVNDLIFNRGMPTQVDADPFITESCRWRRARSSRPRASRPSRPANAWSSTCPAAGGFGDPRKRDRAQVARDVKLGLVSKEQAKAAYGVEGD